jgi:8-oxo-dGTP pyrophosphatase MutT (NUDIX family)
MPAAVLVPLLERRAGGLDVVFTRRAAHLKNHPGQISFPGGRIEPVDRGPAEAALREAREEIGLCPGSVEIAGYLDAQLTVSGFAVTPVVGVVNEASFAPCPDPTEVAEVFVVPLDFFLEPGNRHCGFRDHDGSRFEVIEYHWQERRIWGATASMLMRLVSLLQESDPR